jgi:hypothetical protein
MYVAIMAMDTGIMVSSIFCRHKEEAFETEGDWLRKVDSKGYYTQVVTQEQHKELSRKAVAWQESKTK